MPKTFPIMLEVEEIALGAVLRKLNEMPGIAKLDLNLGHGGQGTGRKQLEDAAASQLSSSHEEEVIRLLMSGPKHIHEIKALVRGPKSRGYSVMNSLRKKGITKPIGGGMHQLTPKASSNFGLAAQAPSAPLALPAPAKTAKPAKVRRGPKGRASRADIQIAIKDVLGSGPKESSEFRKELTDRGISQTSVSGIVSRARTGGIIKHNGHGYELTAKGRKIQTGASANG